MSRRVNATLVGAFVLGALALIVAAILLLAGGEVFRDRKPHIMYFEGAAQGLQVGAPVHFLGVKVGTVKTIRIGLDEHTGRFNVPVIILIEPNLVRTRNGEEIDLRDRATLRRLIERGLRAQLRMQSLLTGQLYVALDFHPEKPAHFVSSDPEASEIPTIRGPVQEFASRLDSFPLDRFLADVAAISESVKGIAADPATRELPERMRAALIHLESLASKLDAQAAPAMAQARTGLAEMRATLGSARSALERVEAAAQSVGEAAERVGAAADGMGTAAERVGAITSPDSAVAKDIRAAAAELAGAARSLRDLTAAEAPAVQNMNTALTEISRAARALRVLAETLDQQPEALIRGKRETGAPR